MEIKGLRVNGINPAPSSAPAPAKKLSSPDDEAVQVKIQRGSPAAPAVSATAGVPVSGGNQATD